MAFVFTLGLHLGKDLSKRESILNPLAKHGVSPVSDQSPGKGEIAEHSGAVADTIDEVVQRNLHREVVRTGLRLKHALPTDLPKTTAHTKGGATNLDRYLIQVGAHPTELQAKRQLKALSARGLRPRLVQGRGKEQAPSYRVVIGGFLSRKLAEEMASRYQKAGWISEWLVARTQSSTR